MNRNNANFLYTLDESEWGDIVCVKEECPGVFYLATKSEYQIICREMYAVTESAVPAIISTEALHYGRRVGHLVIFEYGVEGAGWEIVNYEICRYRVKNNIPLEDDSLYCIAIYGAEKYPEYFGGLLPPRHTPYGLTVRTKKVTEGLYFLETGKCQWVLAIAYIIWNCDLSEYAQARGAFSQADRMEGVEECQYMFFDEGNCALPIYELLQVEDYHSLERYISSRETLETLLYLQHPEYVIENNMSELSGHGKGDMLFDVLALSGYDVPDKEESGEETARRIANCVHITPGAEKVRLLNLP